MRYSQRRKRARLQLRAIQSFFNMTRREREQELVQEFIAKCGVKHVQATSENFDQFINICQPIEAIDYLRV